MIARASWGRPFQISTELRRSATGATFDVIRECCGGRQAAAILGVQDDGFKRTALIGVAGQRLHMVTN